MRVFDSHLHIIDYRYPLVENQGYLPVEFTCADYLAHARKLGIQGGAVVSGSFQTFDQTEAGGIGPQHLNLFCLGRA